MVLQQYAYTTFSQFANIASNTNSFILSVVSFSFTFRLVVRLFVSKGEVTIFRLPSGPTMACPVSSTHHDVPLFPTILGPKETCDEHPFAHPDNREADLKHLRSQLPRALSVIVTLMTHQTRVGKFKKTIFYEFRDVIGEACSMRFLVPNMDRLLAQPKFFVIGFFGFRQENSPVLKHIWELDNKLVAAIPNFEGILAYHILMVSSE